MRKVNYQAARLGILPSALLGRADPDGQLREVRLGAAAGRASCRWRLPRGRTAMSPPTTANPRWPHMTDWVNTTCPALRRSGKARDRYHAAVGGFLLVFPALYGPAQRQGAGHPRKRSNTGARLTGTTAAWSTPPCTCSTAASGTSSCTTSAWCRTTEPYAKRTSHGMILGENGEKMSKSRGNVVNPDDIVDEYGADTMRLYEMFIGDFEKAAPWSPAPASRAAAASSSAYGHLAEQGAGRAIPTPSSNEVLMQPYHQEGRRGRQRTSRPTPLSQR